MPRSTSDPTLRNSFFWNSFLEALGLRRSEEIAECDCFFSTSLAKRNSLLVSDLGGWDAMSGGERLMVANWKAARQAELLIRTELIEKGAVQMKEGTRDLQPGLQRLSGFLGIWGWDLGSGHGNPFHYS